MKQLNYECVSRSATCAFMHSWTSEAQLSCATLGYNIYAKIYSRFCFRKFAPFLACIYGYMLSILLYITTKIYKLQVYICISIQIYAQICIYLDIYTNICSFCIYLHMKIYPRYTYAENSHKTKRPSFFNLLVALLNLLGPDCFNFVVFCYVKWATLDILVRIT